VGFSLPSDRVPLLRQKMEQHSATALVQGMLVPPLEFDAEIELEDLNAHFYEWVEKCGPFGVGNREPTFVTRSVTLASAVRVIKERHVCLEVISGSVRLSALGWSRAGTLWTELCQRMELAAESRIDIAYRLKSKSNSWHTGLELELVDLRRAEPSE
jgi:single-stranded-DNA-specific exonuclease